MEQATELFDSIGAVTDLRRLVQDRTQENIYLEFKMKADRRKPDLDESDSRQFSRALSGFANSDGGVLIWGVETDREERAVALKAISDVAGFESRLKKSMLNAVQPMVDGVLITTIVDDADPTAGYIKCLVPRSEKTPHRALHANREYYRRSTEGFYKLEHFDLEDAFGRRPRPVLLVQLALNPRPEGDPHEEVMFSFLNEGRGVARHTGFTCEFPQGVQVVQTQRINDNTSANSGRPIVSYQEDVAVIHPVPILSAVGKVTIRRTDKAAPLLLTIRWYCESMSLRVWTGTIGPDAQVRQVGTPG